MTSFGIEGILERLVQLDDDLLALYGFSKRFEMVIVGGSALMLNRSAADARFTTDIDVLTSSAEIDELLERYDMNTDVSTFLYQYPENWESRKVRVDFDGQVLDVYTLSNEDLAVTKLLGWRPTDIDDLNDMIKTNSVNITKLREILDTPTEVQANLDSEEWEDLILHLNELLKKDIS